MENAELYEQYNQLQFTSANYYFETYGDILKEYFKNDEITLLDVGSGCGTVLSEIIGKSGLNFKKVYGTDISTDMIKSSGRRFGSEILSFHFLNIEREIPRDFLTIKLDFITSCFSLHRVNDLRKAFENVCDLLKPGGLFSCVFLVTHTVYDIFKALKSVPEYSKYMPDEKEILPPLYIDEKANESVEKHLIEAGMEIVEFKDRFLKFNYETEEKFVDAMKAVYTFLQHIPVDIWDDFYNDFIQTLKGLNRKDPFNVSYRIINFICKKPN